MHMMRQDIKETPKRLDQIVRLRKRKLTSSSRATAKKAKNQREKESARREMI